MGPSDAICSVLTMYLHIIVVERVPEIQFLGLGPTQVKC